MLFHTLCQIQLLFIPACCTILSITYQFKDFMVRNKIYGKCRFNISCNIFSWVLYSFWYVLAKNGPILTRKSLNLYVIISPSSMTDEVHLILEHVGLNFRLLIMILITCQGFCRFDLMFRDLILVISVFSCSHKIM